MYLLANLGNHRSYGYKNINSYVNSYMNNLNKADLTSSIRHIERFSNSEIPIYNSKVPEKMNRIQAVAKCYAYETNATRSLWRLGRLYFNAVNLIRENQN